VIVYLICNTANGMCYVGKTTGTLARRWKQHRCEARLGRKDTPLYRAMRTYQLHCFEVEVLGTAPTQRRLAQLERKFIRIFDAVENGYNVGAISYGARTALTRGSYGRRMSEENKLRLAEGRAAMQERKAAA
jgi:group I intron endonuclease